MPDMAMFNSAPIEDLWQKCMKIEVQPGQDGKTYTYRYMGADIIKMFGRDYTNTDINRKIYNKYPFGVLVKTMDQALETSTLVIDENQLVNEMGKVIKYRSCVLPFGNETKGITHFIVGISDRQF